MFGVETSLDKGDEEFMGKSCDGSKVTSALAAISDEAAVEYLKRYYGLDEWQGREYTGSYFDALQKLEINRLTAEDIVAVACLSIHVPSKAAFKMLTEEPEEISALLAKIPADLALEDIPFRDHDRYFGEGSSPLLLWKLLRAHHGVGPTTVSKLAARKRPALIPIFDSVIARVTGFANSDGSWCAWHHAFSTDKEFRDRLHSLRRVTGIEHISLLRVLDVVLWMHGTRGVEGPERVDDSDEHQQQSFPPGVSGVLGHS